MESFVHLLGSLGDALDNGDIDRKDAAVATAQYIAKRMACSRVSVWVLGGEPGGRVMKRLAAYCAEIGEPIPEETVLTDAEFGRYFDALTSVGVYASDDVRSDELLKPMWDNHLAPSGICASLSATIGVNANTWGVLACSQCGVPRHWLPQEIMLIKRMANEISLRRARRHAQRLHPSGF